MEAIVEYLKTLPHEMLLVVVYQLMEDNKITYHEIMDMHVQNLERMRKGETDAYYRLQAEVMNMWAEYGDWDIYDWNWPIDFPSEYKQIVIDKINEEIPHGCCGGCI